MWTRGDADHFGSLGLEITNIKMRFSITDTGSHFDKDISWQHLKQSIALVLASQTNKWMNPQNLGLRDFFSMLLTNWQINE